MRIFLIAFLMLSCLPGCSPPRTPAVKPPKYPSFVQAGKAQDCGCAPISVRFARASLGLDPTKETPFDRPETLLKSLNDEGSPIKSVITEHKPGACFDELAERPEPGPCDPILLVHPLGHLYLLLGTVSIENTLAYQLIHGDSSLWLAGREGLDEAGFTAAWKFHRVNDEIPIDFAGSHLAVDRIYTNFGKVDPHSELESKVTFRNTGNVPVVFETEALFRGTVSGDFDGTELAPGESRDLRITFQASAGSSGHDSVNVTCYEKGTGYSAQLELLLLASLVQPMTVDPAKLDFGEVRKGETYKRIVNLTEVPADRFSVTGIDPNGNPIRGTVKTASDSTDLKTYQVEAEFTPEEPPEANTFKSFIIETNSLLRPVVRIPFKYSLKSGVCAEPEVISLGSVELGKPAGKTVKLVSAEGARFHCSVANKPEECSVEVHEGKEAVTLEVKITPETEGILQGEIDLRIQTESGTNPLKVTYIGYAR